MLDGHSSSYIIVLSSVQREAELESSMLDQGGRMLPSSGKNLPVSLLIILMWWYIIGWTFFSKVSFRAMTA